MVSFRLLSFLVVAGVVGFGAPATAFAGKKEEAAITVIRPGEARYDAKVIRPTEKRKKRFLWFGKREKEKRERTVVVTRPSEARVEQEPARTPERTEHGVPIDPETRPVDLRGGAAEPSDARVRAAESERVDPAPAAKPAASSTD